MVLQVFKRLCLCDVRSLVDIKCSNEYTLTTVMYVFVCVCFYMHKRASGLSAARVMLVNFRDQSTVTPLLRIRIRIQIKKLGPRIRQAS